MVVVVHQDQEQLAVNVFRYLVMRRFLCDPFGEITYLAVPFRPQTETSRLNNNAAGRL